jgi:dGTP triphosphohydrolase
MARPFERTPDNVAYLKRLTAALIGMFISAVTPLGEFKRPEEPIKLFIDILTGVAWVWMIERSDLTTRQYGQRRIICDLFSGYVSKPDMLPRQRELRDIRAAGLKGEAENHRVVRLICDHIAGMTDQYALRAHEEMYLGKSPFEIRYSY